MKAFNRISLIHLLILVPSLGLSALVQAQENLIALNSDGTVLVTDQAAAIRYCSSLGQHLPTAREWAEAVQNMGVQKIIETHRPNTSATIDRETAQEISWVEEGFGIADGFAKGYYPVYKPLMRSNDLAIDFYFNSSSYRSPAGTMGSYYFWTSSYIPATSPNFVREAYAFAGNSGDLVNVSQDAAAVICFSGLR